MGAKQSESKWPRVEKRTPERRMLRREKKRGRRAEIAFGLNEKILSTFIFCVVAVFDANQRPYG